MAKKNKYKNLSKAELVRRLLALEESRAVDQELQTVLHDLHVHQEEVRAQNEQLLEAKRSLEQARDRYADLYDFAPIAYITLGHDGMVREINLTGTSLLGVERGRITGMPFISFVEPGDRPLFLDHLRRCRAGEAEPSEAVRTELRLVTRKKSVIPVQLFSQGSATPDRGEPGFRTMITDLTEVQKIEEEKRQLILREQAARAAAEAKDEFLAVVSHELRTPLTAILLWAKLLRSGHVTVNQEEVALGAIEHSATAQQQLIEDLLDISRLVSGRLRLEIRETDVVSVIQGAIETVRPAAELKGVQLEAELPSRVSEVRIDPDRIRQVVWNLLHNAVKFTPAGGKVKITTIRTPNRLTIEVKDSGQGISPEFLPHVFERFRQADVSPTRTHGGLGLGLAIARQLVELHGGTIGVHSEGKDKGATFTVELPISAGIKRTAPVAEHAKQVTKGDFLARPVLQNVRILLVEDDEHTRGVVSWLLEQCGAMVTAVASAEAALREFELTIHSSANDPAPRFNLLISDIAMPGMDGYELIRQVRLMENLSAARPALPAIALTAYVRERQRSQALAMGFEDYIPKPIEPEALVMAAARLASRNGDQTAREAGATEPALRQKRLKS